MTERSPPIRIMHPDDPRIAVFRDIRERDLVGRHGFIAEGTVVLEQLLASERFSATSLLILENRLEGVRALLQRVPATVPVHVADRAVFDAVAGFPVHRGVLAHGQSHPATEGEAGATLAKVAASKGVVVVAVGIANHDNIGGIFRNAAAFGVGMVLLDEGCCDPLYRKALRVSVGSVLATPYARVASGEAARAQLSAAGFRCLALSPSGAVGVEAFQHGGPTALFLGTEGDGLPVALMERMEGVRIEMAPGFDSLNVAVTAAIALHRLYCARESAI